MAGIYPGLSGMTCCRRVGELSLLSRLLLIRAILDVNPVRRLIDIKRHTFLEEHSFIRRE